METGGHYKMMVSKMQTRFLGTHLVNAASPLAHADSSDPSVSAIFVGWYCRSRSGCCKVVAPERVGD